jgi:hypothetical protein
MVKYFFQIYSERYVCKADTKFALKAFQKENPFFILFAIFILTCVCFGFALRTYELYYWETKQNIQNWNYHWNAMWCIFVSMTTVGYGDFYAKTHIGRFITIIACSIGIYFVSMMMVFMTQKSVLNENETKAYKLITRLKLRNEIKDIQAFMINHFLNMVLFKKRKTKKILSDKQFHIKFNYEKRNIITHIEVIKNKLRVIKSFEVILMKEHLFDISERIDMDIKEIKQELGTLKFINETLISFTDSQIEVAKYLKKNCYATKLLYSIIQKKPIFGKLNNVDQNYQALFETELDKKELVNNNFDDYNDSTKNLFHVEDEGMDEEFEDNIFNYDVTPDQVREYFDFIFSKNEGRKNAVTKASRTMNFIQRIKTNNSKIKKVSSFKKKPTKSSRKLSALARELKESIPNFPQP